jgi:hypothetical protein
MKNKNLLIGVGVVVVGYLFWKKSQSKVNQTQYSKECYDSLQSRLMQKDAKPANFQKDFLERCQKITNEANLQVKNNSIDPRKAECMKQGRSWDDVEKFCGMKNN